jgi:O-antigen/teichoic acid export membrane protein
MGGGLSAVVLLTALSPWLIKALTAPAYYSSYPIVGILALSSIFYGFMLISGAGLWKAEKTWGITLSLTVGSITNILLNLLLVPSYGMLGASVATSLAMLMSNIFLLALSERYWAVGFSLKVILAQLILAIVAVAGILLVYVLKQSILIVFILTGLSIVGLLYLALGRQRLADN